MKHYLTLFFICLLLPFHSVGEPLKPLPFPSNYLLFSDHPEKVYEAGRLARASIKPLRATRLQYYHLGQSQDPLNLYLKLHNPSNNEATLWYSWAPGVSSDDYFSVGQTNNLALLQLKRSDLKEITLKAGETLTLWETPLKMGEVVSGTFDISVIEGEDCQLELQANSPQRPELPWILAKNPKDVHARGLYPIFFQESYRYYNTEQESAFAVLGATRQPYYIGNQVLKGDYGVGYKIHFTVENPQPHPVRCEVALNPRGGAATMTLLYQDKIFQTKPTKAYKIEPLFTFTVPAQSKLILPFYSVPEGASNLPVRLLIQKAP